MYKFPRLRRTDPFRIALCIGNASIDALRPFGDDPRPCMGNPFPERPIHFFRCFLVQTNFNLNPRLAQLLKPFARHQWVGILCCCDHAPDSRGDNRFCARSGLSGIATRFQGHVERGIAHLFSRFFKRKNFRMWAAEALVIAASNNFPVSAHHGTHYRIGLNLPSSALRQFQGQAHKRPVFLIPYLPFNEFGGHHPSISLVIKIGEMLTMLAFLARPSSARIKEEPLSPVCIALVWRYAYAPSIRPGRPCRDDSISCGSWFVACRFQRSPDQ